MYKQCLVGNISVQGSQVTRNEHSSASLDSTVIDVPFLDAAQCFQPRWDPHQSKSWGIWKFSLLCPWSSLSSQGKFSFLAPGYQSCHFSSVDCFLSTYDQSYNCSVVLQLYNVVLFSEAGVKRVYSSRLSIQPWVVLMVLMLDVWSDWLGSVWQEVRHRVAEEKCWAERE